MNHKGIFYFDPDDSIYQHHFKGRPIVPGSLIVHAFFSEVQKYSQSNDRLLIERFRFKMFVSPGEYTFEVKQKKYTYRCKLFNQERCIVNGVLSYA